jgi:hypothetical protein
MLDELDRLRNNPHLLNLLNYYAHLGQENREVWQARLMVIDGLDAADITKLHGELIAFSWVDQNTGHTPGGYRITSQGQRAIRLLNGEETSEETAEAQEKPKFPRKKRDKGESPVTEAA